MSGFSPLRWLRGLLFRLEAVLALCIAWFLVFHVPFRLVARLFGGVSDPGPALAGFDPQPAPVLVRARGVGHVVDAMSLRLPWHSTCLVRCVAGRMMLTRRGIAGHIVFGVNRRDGALTAHAWLVTGGEPVIGGSEATGFTPNACLYALPRTV
ncbi:MAG: lasso peptide biosynthesis B2 protein [Niveispirillum sp.]|nr:lasso peptide biosynthesis B2 protein [Niveispirillum sp.]